MKSRKIRRIIKRIIKYVLIAGVVGCIVASFVVLNWFEKTYGVTIAECAQDAKDVVDESSADDFKSAEATTIYASDGTLIAELSNEAEISYLEYDDIPEDVINAFVAVEDRTFWDNIGIDIKGIFREVLGRITGSSSGGASTITQQLARGTYLTNEVSYERKVREIFIALELTEKYTKEEIIEFYINTCCFANGIYGIEDAAEAYFGKEVSELNTSEIAYLCAIPNRPEYYDPWDDPDTALTRRDKILEDMYECGYISGDELSEALEEEIIIVEQEADETSFYNYETTYAIYCATEYLMESVYGFDFQYQFSSEEKREEYEEEYDEAYETAKHDLYTGGYSIYTSIDLEVQDALQEILDEELSFDTETGEDGIYNLQGSVTAVDNETGKVIATIGGRQQDEISQMYSLNRSFQSTRQPGSTIKPLLVYTPALMDGYTASDYLYEIDVSEAKELTSEEIDEMTGTRYTLRNAVENSRNGCAYYLLNQIGVRYAFNYLYSMEFSNLSSEDLTLSSALGGLTYGTNTVEMAGAYRTLANHGTYDSTDCLLSILNSDGEEIYEQAESVVVYSEEAADRMTDILMGVLTDGTAKSSYWYSSTNTEAAGKTGTTNDTRDVWFCGYTPSYTISVWVGTDDNTEYSGLSSSTYPLSIWKKAMLYLIDGDEMETFDLCEEATEEETYSYSYSYDEDDEDDDEEEEDIDEDQYTYETVEEDTSTEDAETKSDAADSTENKSDNSDSTNSKNNSTNDSNSSQGTDAKKEDNSSQDTDDSDTGTQDDNAGQSEDSNAEGDVEEKNTE